MSHRKCNCNCVEQPCYQQAFPYGFSSHGDHSTICGPYSTGSWFTPEEPGDWPKEYTGFTSILIDGVAHAISGTSGGPRADSLYITPAITYPWQLDFDTEGATARQCDNRFTITPPPANWDGISLAGCQVKLDGISYPTYTIVANDDSSFTLDGDYCPTVSFQVVFTYYQAHSGYTVADDGTITLSTPPEGWHTDQLVGHVIELRDGNSTVQLAPRIISNTATAMMVDAPMPTTHGTGFSIAGNVMTPAVAPTGWQTGGSKEYGFRNRTLELVDPDGIVQYTSSVDRFASTTSMYIYTPRPPDGDYPDWTWRIVAPFGQWGFLLRGDTSGTYFETSGSALPCTVDGNPALKWWTPSYNQFPSGWLGGEFVGCTVNYDGAAGTVIANDADSITVSYASKSFGPRQWQLNVTPSGTGYVDCSGVFSTIGASFPSGASGWPITIRGTANAIDTVQTGGYKFTTRDPINTDHPWRLPSYDSGQYWDVLGDGLATSTNDTGISCGQWALVGIAKNSADGAKVLWHTPPPVWQYLLSLPILNNDATAGTARIYFGPGGNSYLEVPFGPSGSEGTASLVVPGKTQQKSYAVYMSSSSAVAAQVCVTRTPDGDYLVYATVPDYNRPQGVLPPGPFYAKVAKGDWQSNLHRLGIGTSHAARLCNLSVYETRGRLPEQDTKCSYCIMSCYIPGWEGGAEWPQLTLNIVGGPLAGNYVLVSYGSCCWGVSLAPSYPCGALGLGASITVNPDDTFTLTAVPTRACSGIECFGSACYYAKDGGASGTFSGLFSNETLNLASGGFCGATSVTATFQ